MGCLQQAISELCRNKTTIIIAHRLNTIRYANKILVLDHGHLKEQGTHEELMNMQGIYYQMLQARKNLKKLVEES